MVVILFETWAGLAGFIGGGLPEGPVFFPLSLYAVYLVG